MASGSVLAAFLRRDWQIDVSYRAAFGLQLISVLLYLAMFFFLGKIVDTNAFAGDEQLSGGYFGFVALGLALLDVVEVSLSSFSRKLREEQTTGTLEALIALPTNQSLIILSTAAYDLLRALANGFIVVVAAVLVFGLQIETDPTSLLLTLVALVGCVGLFASLGVAIAAFTVVFKRGTALVGMVVAGLGLLGGVYFPIEVLPQPLETIASILPFTWALDVVRAGLLGGDIDMTKLAGLWVSVAILLPVSLLVFRESVRQARRAGTLAQY